MLHKKNLHKMLLLFTQTNWIKLSIMSTTRLLIDTVRYLECTLVLLTTSNPLLCSSAQLQHMNSFPIPIKSLQGMICNCT